MNDNLALVPRAEPRVIQPHEARVNVTYQGQNFDLPDPVPFASAAGDVRQWVAEAIRAGIPGVCPPDPNVDLTSFVVDPFARPEQPTAGQPDYNRIFLRPKTAFGA